MHKSYMLPIPLKKFGAKVTALQAASILLDVDCKHLCLPSITFLFSIFNCTLLSGAVLAFISWRLGVNAMVVLLSTGSGDMRCTWFIQVED